MLHQSNYIYNSTKIYKNNYPIDIDVDSICDELYSIAGNRESFEEIMKRIENDIMNSEVSKKSKKDEKGVKQNTFYSANDLYNGNKFIFRTTLPEGELMKEPILNNCGMGNEEAKELYNFLYIECNKKIENNWNSIRQEHKNITKRGKKL